MYRELHTWFSCGELKEKYVLKDIDVSWRVILKWIINNWVCMAGM